MCANDLQHSLSFLTLAAILAACGTTETFIPWDTGTDATDTVPDGSGDTDDDTGEDTTPDTGEDTTPDTDVSGCDGPNPSLTCQDFGCPEGQECVEIPDGCVPSSCSCGDDGHWICTEDCGPDFECRPIDDACPATAPIGGACSVPGLECSWGTECCCGDCYPSTVCQCSGTSWTCYATDACMIPDCEGQPCESDLDCESWGSALECIAGTCTRPPVDGGWKPGPDIDIVVGCDGDASDPFHLNSATLDGDALKLSVSYGGGCAEHLFRMCWDGSFMESWPVQVSFALQHEGNDDPCDAYPTEELTVSLDTLRQAYEDGYGSAEGIVMIHFADDLFEYMFEAP